MDDRTDIIARAIKDCADKFHSPVQLYIEPESRHRYQSENPNGDPYDDKPSFDWDFESYRIIARAVEAALTSNPKPTPQD